MTSQLPQPQPKSRLPIQLGQIDQILPMMGSNQPLSPTHTVATNNSTSSYNKQKEGVQTALKGNPTMVGITSLEYSMNEKTFGGANDSINIISQVKKEEINENYFQQIYEEQHKNTLNMALEIEQYGLIQVQLVLPFEMLVEQIELRLSNSPLFHKYLKLLKVDKLDQGSPSSLKLRSGFIDAHQDVIELNTCGYVSHFLLSFIYDKRSIKFDPLVKNNSTHNHPQMTSEKLKNEILPLLNGSDDDIDELDDEVAMISNKKDHHNQRGISAEDIKITFIEESKSKEQLGRSNKMNAKLSREGSKKDEDDSEHTRNFNTLPRNYSDSQSKAKQNLLNIEVDSKAFMNERDNKNQEQQKVDEMVKLEQQIFDGSNNWFYKLITKSVKSIRVFGFNSNQIPAITNMTLFMNESFYLKKEKLMQDAMEVDMLVGILMISNKRYTQASELFRKIQAYYIHQIESMSNQQKGQKQGKTESNKMYLKCAILELLVVESMCSAQQINDKLASIKRMVDFFMGKMQPPHQFQQQIFLSEDPYTTMIKILPSLLKFVLMCMTHKKEAIKLSALKLLEFILETKGCSLDQAMALILKAILKTYPGVQAPPEKKQSQALAHSESFCISVISSNASEYLRSPRQGGPLKKEGDFNQTVNLNLKGMKERKNSEGRERVEHTEYSQIKEPNSGFQQALKNAYNHVLDTYISVLSSISSHILHQLFYDVIVATLLETPPSSNPTNAQSLSEIKVFSIKIAEKIITICQGDLLLSKHTLDSLLAQISIKSIGNDQLQSSIKTLWQSIRTKVFANYSMKGMKGLIEWLVEKMTILAQSGPKSVQVENSNKSSGGSDLGKMEISDEESLQLQQLLDIVSLISIGKKKNEEEANNLIKIKQDYCVDLYLMINPLLFWLDFSVEREERLSLFKAIYQTIKDVLENLPPKKVDLDVLQIMIPILQKTTEYLKNNSPSLAMLKFLDLVLRDIKAGGYCIRNQDLQYFFLDMLNNFAPYISYSLYEEVFSVFDKLLSLCSDVLTEKVVHKCILSLVDKYTMKNKSHKNSVAAFMKVLLEVKVSNQLALKKEKPRNNNEVEEEDELDNENLQIQSKNNFMEILSDFCLFKNEDSGKGEEKMKNPADCHDLYVDKLQFFIDTLSMLSEVHINIYTSLIMHPKFKSSLMNLLNKGETSLRLKCHEILEIVTNYYVQYCTSKTVYELAVPQTQVENGQKRKGNAQNEVMEVEFINHERLYISQIVFFCIKNSLEQKNDSYLQFNSLILLDFLFQNLLPVPSYQNEYLKGKGINIGTSKSNQNQSSEKFGKPPQDPPLDIETLDITDQTPELEVTDERYLNMRLNLVFKLWPHIQVALNSAWSNIRSICYGLICSMLKVDLRDFQFGPGQTNVSQQMPSNSALIKLKQVVLPMLMTLLSSKESESKAGGLNILGSFCGLSYDFSKVKISKNLDFFKKNSNFVSLSIWQLVFDLQDDWDITIKEASVVLIQLCAPRDAVKYFDKVKREKENMKFASILNRYAATPGGGAQSQQSSRNQFYLNSGASNEEEYQMIGQANGGEGKQNIMSFLSGNDEMSMVQQMEQHIGGMDMFDIHSQQQQQQYLQGLKLNSQRNHQKDDPKKSAQNILDLDMQQLLQGNLDSHAYHDQYLNNAAGADLDIMAEIEGNLETFSFFVDEYSDDQIQEIISIFRNDFKPPKNLWIEKNPSAAFNAPDYYAEIYSQAIDQFNQQQLQLQQQQQQELQMKVSNSPKAGQGAMNIKNGLMGAVNRGSAQVIDALEDDLVKKYEIEQKEREQAKSKGPKQQENYLIFERHFEDDDKPDQKQQKDEDLGSIDAEPYKFLEGEPIEQEDQGNKKKGNPPMQIIEEQKQEEGQVKEKGMDSKQTDELIEEYEKKINKTIQLLEEEKKKTISKNNEDALKQEEANAKSTPEFKQKRDKIQENTNLVNLRDPQPSKLKKQSKEQQQYLSELSRGYINNVDNMKLIKQINNVFNDSQLINNFPQTNGQQKQKQKLNKSFENLIAAHKSNLKSTSQEGGQKGKKNLSSSPRRGSSSGKKIGSKSQGNNKKKYISDQSKQSTGQQNLPNQNKALYNMRDLNFFIKTIEKDLSEKFNKMSVKDFNSMPTTPTSILKKVEDQVKAMAQKKDAKAYMSNTCPNIAQVLGSLDTSQSSKSNQVLQISNVQNMSSAGMSLGSKGNTDAMGTSVSQTPSNLQNLNAQFLFGSNAHPQYPTQSTHHPQKFGLLQNPPISYQPQILQQNNLEKFSFSKTQKIDLSSINKGILNNPPFNSHYNDEQSQRDSSNENFGRGMKVSPKMDDKMMYTNLLKSSKNQKQSSAKNSKRSRMSQDKYSAVHGNYGANNLSQIIGSSAPVAHASSSSSQSKLNKSANMIQQSSSTGSKSLKKQPLNKSYVDTKQMTYGQMENKSLSPQNTQKKQVYVSNQNSTVHQTPATQHHQNNMNMYTQYSSASSHVHHEMRELEKKQGKISLNMINYTTNNTMSNKTPIKSSGGKGTKGYTYSEIIEVSPSSGEKEMKINQRQFY